MQDLINSFDGYSVHIWTGNLNELQEFCHLHNLHLNYTIYNYIIYFTCLQDTPPHDDRIKEI